RVGLASLLAPLGLSAPALFVTTMVIEPTTGVQGMGALTTASVLRFDASWLLVAWISVVPLLMAGRWARRVLVWALSDAPSVPPGVRASASSAAPTVAADSLPSAATSAGALAGSPARARAAAAWTDGQGSRARRSMSAARPDAWPESAATASARTRGAGSR